MTWTVPAVERTPSPKLVDERSCLQGWLDFHRQTLLSKCEGLTHEQLALRNCEPSRLSLLGLVGALTLTEFGTTYYDNVMSVFVLSGLAILILKRDTLRAGPLPKAAAIAAAAPRRSSSTSLGSVV